MGDQVKINGRREEKDARAIATDNFNLFSIRLYRRRREEKDARAIATWPQQVLSLKVSMVEEGKKTRERLQLPTYHSCREVWKVEEGKKTRERLQRVLPQRFPHFWSRGRGEKDARAIATSSLHGQLVLPR